MSLPLNLYNGLNLLLLLGVLQGLIVSVLLLAKKSSRLANRLLAAWVFVLALSNVYIIILTSNLYLVLGQRFTLMAPFSLKLFWGPLIWFFCLAITQEDFGLGKKEWIHLLPGWGECLYYLLVFVQPLAFRQQFYGQVHWKYVEPSLEVVGVVSFMLYLYASLRHIRAYGENLKENFSEANLETYDWLRRFLWILLVFSLLWLVLTVVDVFFMNYELGYVYFYPYYLTIAFLGYFIGYSGYYRSEIIRPSFAKTNPPSKELLNKDQQIALRKRLLKYVEEEKPYLNPHLRASDLAQTLGTNVQTLSYVLNHTLKKSFHDFINEWRVEQVKVLLEGEEADKLSLLGIARESGFNSESSFYRIFKKMTGFTPKAYLHEIKKGNTAG